MTRSAPKPLGDPVKHLWLAQDMARAAGVDLVARRADGTLTQADWAGMVQRCRGCDWERGCGGCHGWLAGQDPGTAIVPPACANGATFEALGARGTAARTRDAG